MWRGFIHFLKKDFRLMLSGKFFILAFASLILYSCYINFIYVNMDQEIYPVYLYDPQGRQAAVSKYMIPLDDREDFEKQIQTYDSSPSLNELQKGFQGSEIRSFSGSMVELCKFYQILAEETDEYYYLAIFKNKVVVYKSDGKTIYMETDIPAEDLPPEVMQELIRTRVVNTEEDLYDFLESYSS